MAREYRRKKGSVKKRKRRGFFGVRPQEKAGEMRNTSIPPNGNHGSSHVSNEIPMPILNPTDESISSKKLLNSSFEMFESKCGPLTRKQARKVGLGSTPDVEMAKGFKLQDATLLNDCISTAAICSSCRKPNSKLELYQNNCAREGLSESLFLKCSACKVVTQLSTSKRLGGRGGGSHEVNRRAVLASGKLGHAGLSQFCGVMNLPPPMAKEAYQNHLIQIEKATKSNAEEVMKDAAKRLRDKVSIEHPNDIEMDGEELIANVAVTVDGTWQKRGHSSKIGVVFVISVLTGEILDYEVKSLFCHECKAHGSHDQDSVKYKEWKKAHEKNCEVNHQGSSEEMEAVSAVDIFTRSIETRNLKYTTFVGDGDSSSFGRVKEALEKKFGERYVVKKEECVGHVQKRLGTALRKYKNDKKGQKLSDGKGVGGRGRLTDKVVDKMQNYYGKAIRGNKGDLEGMKKSINAIQHHMIKSDKKSLEEQHQYCPQSGDTWCKYWKDKHDHTSLYNEDNRLPVVFMAELDPIFARLSQDKLLIRCLKGITQNQNEAANGLLWSKCPKTKFCGARRVRIAACETIAAFNTGAASKAVVLDLCGVTPGAQTMSALRKQDDVRMKNAAKKISEKYRKKRQKLRSEKKDKSDKKSYQPGGFGLSAKPINDTETKKKKKKTAPKKNNEQPEIRFVMPTYEVVAKRKRK